MIYENQDGAVKFIKLYQESEDKDRYAVIIVDLFSPLIYWCQGYVNLDPFSEKAHKVGVATLLTAAYQYDFLSDIRTYLCGKLIGAFWQFKHEGGGSN